MANYSLVIDSTFQPFSFERYIQPYQIYDQAYREVEDNLSDLETEAGQWDKLANETTDPETHATYRKYADDLRKQADKLSTYGLNPQSRRSMLNMRRRFSSEIVPIVKAYERRRQLADEQRQRNADGTLRFSTDFSKVSLDDMIANPELSYSTVSGHEVMERASQMFSKLAAVVNKEPSVSKRDDLKGYLQILRQSGYDPEVALQEYGAKMPAEIKKVYDNIDKSFANEPAYSKEWGHSWIGQGAYNAIGTKAYEVMDDKMVMSAAQAAADRREGQRIAEQTRANKAQESIARAKLAEDKRQFNETMAFNRGKANGGAGSAFDKDGHYSPTFIASLGGAYTLNPYGNGYRPSAAPPENIFKASWNDKSDKITTSKAGKFEFDNRRDVSSTIYGKPNSPIVKEAVQMVADYFGLKSTGQNSDAYKLARQYVKIYQDPGSGWWDDQWMIAFPGVDPTTGSLRKDWDKDPNYMQFISTWNSKVADAYNREVDRAKKRNRKK